MKVLRFLSKYRLDAVLMLALFLLAFGIRIQPSSDFSNIFGFDSYWSARMAKYLITGEKPGWPITHFTDTTADYPWGRPDVGPSELGWWALTAPTYKLLGGPSQPFDYDLFAKIAVWMVALVGALGAPAAYFLGRATFNRWAGLAAAFFLLTSTNHLFYSIYGHAENDALGLTLFFLGLALFVATVKTRNWKVGVLSAAVFAWLSIVWQSYAVGVMLIAGCVLGYFLLTSVYNYITSMITGKQFFQDSEKRRTHREWLIYSTGFVFASAFFAPFVNFTSYLPIAAGALGFTIIICSLVETFRRGGRISLQQPLIKLCGVVVLFMVLAGFVAGFSELVKAPLGFVGISFGGEGQKAPAAYEKRMLETIAEQNPVGGDTFFEKLDTLKNSGFGLTVWLAFFAILVASFKIFVMPFWRKDFYYEWDVFVFGFVLFSMVFLTSVSVSMFFLSAAVAFGAAYFVAHVLRLLEIGGDKLGRSLYAKAGGFALILLFAFAFTTPAVHTGTGFGSDVPREWFETFAFLNTVPNGSVITAWWDYGHWMNYFNGDNIRTTIDNIQDRKDMIYTVASAFTHTTPCKLDTVPGSDQQTISCDSTPEALEKAELESLSLLKPLKTTHILIDREIVGGTTGGKYGALQHIASVSTGCMMNLGCSKNADGSTACVLGKDTQGKDVGLTFSTEDWSQLVNKSWPGTPFDAYGFSTRLFGRNTTYGDSIYMSGVACGADFFRGGANANAPVLYAFLERLFFKDPALKHVRLVFDNGWNVIYEVDWTGVPDPENYTSWTKDHSVLCTGAAENTCKRLNKWPADLK